MLRSIGGDKIKRKREETTLLEEKISKTKVSPSKEMIEEI